MNNQPTDCRAEAEMHRLIADDWLGRAVREYPRSLEHATPAALIGIGHALLADPPPPPRVITFNGPVTEAEIQRVKAAFKDDQ